MDGRYLERSATRNFDFTTLALTMTLCAIGFMAIYSANMQSDSANLQGMYIRQAAWTLSAMVIIGAMMFVDYRTMERLAYPLYWIGVLSLLAVTFFGKTVSGAQRWLSLGGLNVQPSEFMKIAVILLVVRIIDDMERETDLTLWDLLRPAAYVVVPFLLVAKQPDLGTAMIYFIILAGIAFFAGINKGTLLRMGVAIALFLPTSWMFLKPYQKNRLLTLLNPEEDPMGKGYHTIQSKIAIGSGGLWGKGLFQGTQSKLNFLPEKHTDFIFSVISEEVGFIGSLVILFIFFLLIMRIVDVAMTSRDKGGALLAAGVGTMISFNFLYNIGMTLGIVPIVGVPLPFISYGGSALLTNAIGVGIALNVSFRRFSVD
ncbi:MAG: rod shape-determining protein RodA [Nitrospinae bacterium]|nr:rod shape-determining protein RodA [Nitrospinota bacterium]